MMLIITQLLLNVSVFLVAKYFLLPSILIAINKKKEKSTSFTVSISGEKVKVNVSVNEKGNLVIEGIESVTCELWNDELCLTRYRYIHK